MDVVFNADDVGYSRTRDEGIFQTLQCNGGVVSSVSVLVNGMSAKQAAQYLKKAEVDVGLHVNITEGIPVAKPACVATLLQGGYFRGKMEFREALQSGLINLGEVRMAIMII